MSDYSEQQENRFFEAQVRRAAEAVWGLAAGECQPEHYASSGPLTELDGIVRIRDVTHLVMATVSRKLDKAKEDVKKLNLAERIEARRGVAIKKWFITQYQLDAQHVRHAAEAGVTALTLDDFRNRFFDGRSYVAKRRNGAFGSARNLSDGTISIPDDEYVELPMRAQELDQHGRIVERPASLDDILAWLTAGEAVVLIAPFGAGKSLTTREIFLRLTAKFLRDASSGTPVVINLREHWAQQFADEVLERHARTIGFAPREDLVVAWRAGIVHVLLDGFDEVASPFVATPDKMSFMREARSQALEGVRDLIRNVPAGVGVFACGRDHYFDNRRELETALGLVGRAYRVVTLGEFTEAQAAEFLKRRRVKTSLPDWLPRKPLVLGYLAHRGILNEVLEIDASQGFGHAWDQFLTLICQREATYGRSVMDPDTLRRVLERLASQVRSTSSGNGPIAGRDLAEAYQAVTGQVPGEGVLMQLQRLPGLTARDQDPEARSFVDEDLLAALQGSSVARTILEGQRPTGARRWLSGLSTKAVAMAAHVVRTARGESSTAIAAALQAQKGDRWVDAAPQFAGDCLSIALELSRETGLLDCLGLDLDAASFGTLDIEEVRVLQLTIENSTLSEVVIGPATLQGSVSFRNCAIERIVGAASEDALPSSVFQKCVVEEYDDMATNTAIVRSELAPPVKALLTILRKLYLQAGGGRKVSALKRGLPAGAVHDAVDSVLEILQSEKLLDISSGIAHPIRRQTSRVHQILAAPALSADEIMKRVRQLR